MKKFNPGYKWRTLVKSELNDTSRQLTHDYNGNYSLSTYFDELVIDNWLHLEMMDDKSYWARIGDYRIDIKFDGTSDNPEVYVEKEEK